MIRAVKSVADMPAYALADLGNSAAISLAQNECAFAPSPTAIDAGRQALRDGPLYPDPDWGDLRRAIAEVHAVPPEQILCGAGSMELIGCVIRAFAGPGDEVLGSQYGYLFAATAAQQAGATYITAAETGFTVSVDHMLKKVTARTRVVFICNPGNPTGTRIANAEISRLRDGLPDTVLLVVDQAYGEFDDQDPREVFALVARGNTIVIRSFSKAYGLASARVGWGLFPGTIAPEVRKLLNPNNVPCVSQQMAAAAMRDQAHMRGIVSQTAQIRDGFSRRLRQAGLTVPESHTNFVLIAYATAERATRADTLLRAEGYVLRAMGGYGLGSCLRVTIGTQDVMATVADILVQEVADEK
ncbi:histidinol-phosphate transaminase [uncultured Roseobacter sp.]|uniref:pyridoxal phosphate-dependent aminotransferase n=1 Tax=uncultured Roseobacter sp. TaxID=114847 RepID=UPI002633D433|nr:histidinol-phosphate transaminase [uncultured Roseobacter sp.]